LVDYLIDGLGWWGVVPTTPWVSMGIPQDSKAISIGFSFNEQMGRFTSNKKQTKQTTRNHLI
jgi:hypothetical protein